MGEGSQRARLRSLATVTGLLAAMLAGSARGNTPAAPPIPPPGEASVHFDAQARTGKKDLLAVLEADGRFQLFLRSVQATGLTQLLHGRGPLTVFAPTDAAFGKQAASKLERWNKDPKVLKVIMRYHLLRAYVPAKQLVRLRNALTTAGVVVQIDGASGLKVNGNRVSETDLFASNGVVHVVEGVLIPPEAKSAKKRRGDRTDSPVGDEAEGGGDKAEKSEKAPVADKPTSSSP